jgi:hypothetical protein
MRLSGARFTGLMMGAMVVLSACASAPAQQQTDATGLAPTMIIERFLRAANQNDLDAMAGLFGTRDGSVTRSWSKREVDDRMFLFASLLRHSDYTIGAQQIVPGRRDEAARYDVQLVLQQGPVQVPFTMVITRNNQWLIEEIGIERITHPGRSHR